MKIFKNSLLFVLLSLFVVFQGFCNTSSDWVESQYTVGNQTFVISFPGVPTETVSPQGFLELNFNLKNVDFTLSAMFGNREELINLIKEAGKNLIDTFDETYFNNKEFIVKATNNDAGLKAIVVGSNLYMLALRDLGDSPVIDLDTFFNSFSIVEIRE